MEKSPARRLFLALSAASLEPAIAPWQKKLKIGADRKELSVRWTPPELRHITLLFLGEVDPERQVRVEETIRPLVAQHPRFHLKVEDLGAFPEPRSARVIWFGVQNSRKLHELRNNLIEPLNALGWNFSDEGYVPHLTIGRLRNPKSVTDFLSPFVRAGAGKLEVTELVLFESVLQAPFPVYKELARFPLQTVSP